MYDLLLEQKSLVHFHKKLKELVEEFYQPEIGYVVVDEEQELRYLEFLKKEADK